MECHRLAELLPWYLNGTLADDQRQRLEEHLAGCDRCRREERQAQAALVLFGAHLPSAAIVDYADGREHPAIPRDLVEAHLGNCDRCAEELAWVRDSREALAAGAETGAGAAGEDAGQVIEFPAPRAAPRSAPFWRRVALAASLAALAAGAGWLWSWQSLRDGRSEVAERPPQLNVVIADLYPHDLVLRGSDPAADELELGNDLDSVTLILNSNLPPAAESWRLEIEDPRGEVLRRLDGLERHPAGDFTLALPLADLPAGRLTLLVYGSGAEPVESYSFRRHY